MSSIRWQHSPEHYLAKEETISLDAARVLLVGPLARTRLGPALRDAGYEVIKAPLGYGMLRHVHAHHASHWDPVDAIVIDLSHDHRRGLMLVEAVRKTDWALPVFALCSGSCPAEIREELARYGVRAFSTYGSVRDMQNAVTSAVPPLSLAAA